MNIIKIIKQLCKYFTILSMSFISLSAYSAEPLVGPFTTQNGKIIAKDGKAISLRGISWFGFNTSNYILHGLWSADFNSMLQQIKSLGFNAVRIPFQFDFVLNPSIKPSSINTSCSGPNTCNTNVPQDSALKALQWVVEQFTNNGIYVLLDDHYEDNLYVDNPADWLKGWQTIAQLFKENALVGYDLYNEPDSHGITWEGNNGKPAWGDAILSAANAIYAIDPNKLIFIEGTGQGGLEANWGNGFATDDQTVASGQSHPKNFFTQLLSKPYANQIIISPHVYGPDGTNGGGADESDQAHAFATWSRLFGYLNNNFSKVNNTAASGFCLNATTCHVFPIAIGEFGGKFDPNDPWYAKDTATNINLASFLNQLSNKEQANWFYWDWNPNSGNTGGILKDDWKTIDCVKVNYLVKNLGLKPETGICPAS